MLKYKVCAIVIIKLKAVPRFHSTTLLFYILQKYYITAPQQQLHISRTYMTVNRFKALDFSLFRSLCIYLLDK